MDGGVMLLLGMLLAWWAVNRMVGFSWMGLYDDWNQEWIWEDWFR